MRPLAPIALLAALLAFPFAAPARADDPPAPGSEAPGVEGIKKKIPYAILDAKPAADGKFIVFKFAGTKKVGVFDVEKAKFAGYLEVPSAEEFTFAAGGNSLVIFDPKENVFQRYDLTTLQRVKSKTSPIQGVITQLEMGISSDKRAILSYGAGPGASPGASPGMPNHRVYGLLDLEEFKLTPLEMNLQHLGGYGTTVHIRPDARLERVTMWATSQSPTGFLFALLSAKPKVVYQHTSFGGLGIASDGSYVYTTYGAVLDTQGKVMKQFGERGSSQLFPVHGGAYFLEVQDQSDGGRRKATATTVKVIEQGSYRAMHTIEVPLPLPREGWQRSPFLNDRRILAFAKLDRLVVINDAALELMIYDLGLGKSGGPTVKGGKDAVRPGETWTAELNLPSGSKVSMEDAPEGVKLDMATMTLTWTVPEGVDPGEKEILLLVKRPGAEEKYERVFVTVERGPARGQLR